MPRITLTTIIPAKRPETVWQRFDDTLFQKLNPPWIMAELLRFDGNQVGHEVHIAINFIFFKQKWISVITSNTSVSGDYEFVDEGRQLPFFLKTWRHRHVIRPQDQGTAIIDDIQFSTGWLVGDVLLYPLLWAQFAYRKPVYRRYFA
jgi:ligand-binding SRPBCC domain-containing protein